MLGKRGVTLTKIFIKLKVPLDREESILEYTKFTPKISVAWRLSLSNPLLNLLLSLKLQKLLQTLLKFLQHVHQNVLHNVLHSLLLFWKNIRNCLQTLEIITLLSLYLKQQRGSKVSPQTLLHQFGFHKLQTCSSLLQKQILLNFFVPTQQASFFNQFPKFDSSVPLDSFRTLQSVGTKCV